MLIRAMTRAMTAALAVLLALAIAPAQAQQAALAGQVTSAEEGAMEGVIVSAKRDGSHITVSVISNDQGRFSFPAGAAGAWRLQLATRAVGYDLEGPKTATVAAGTTATVDLKLRKTRNLSASSSPMPNG